jgi:hypothetical protein
MVDSIATAWLYAYSPQASQPSRALHTVFVSGPREKQNGQDVLATISMSYLTTNVQQGAGALVRSYTPAFGPDWESHDFKDNAVFAPQCLAVTFELSATTAEAYAQATIFVFD